MVKMNLYYFTYVPLDTEEHVILNTYVYLRGFV